MKKIKLFALAAFAMLSTNVMAQTATTQWKYTVKAGTNVTIDGLPDDLKGTKETIEIPGDFTVGSTKYTVVEITAEAFKEDTKITTVSIPASVTKIGDGAFLGCTKLATVNFAASSELAEIGNFAFGGTPSLTTISFANCSKMKDFKRNYATSEFADYNAGIPGAVNTSFIPTATTTPNLTTINGLGGITGTYTGTQALNANDAALYNATLPGALAGASPLDGSSFPFLSNYGVANNYLKSVTLNGETTNIGRALASLPNLESLAISETKIASLVANALAGDTKITSLVLPAAVATIEAGALAGSKVTTLTINSSSTVSATVVGAVGGENLASLTFAGEAFAGNLAANSFTLADAGTLTFGNIGAATIAAGAIKVADTKKAGAIVIGDIANNISGLFSGKCGAVTVGDIAGTVPMASFGEPTSLTIKSITGGQLTGTAPVYPTPGATLITTLQSLTITGNVTANAFGANALILYSKLATITLGGEVAASAFTAGSIGKWYDTDGDLTDDLLLHAGSAITTSVANPYQLTISYSPETATNTAFAATAFNNGTASASAWAKFTTSNDDLRTAVAALTCVDLYIDPAPVVPATETITVTGKADSNWNYGKFYANGSNYKISADDAVVYSAYVDGENIYMDPLQIAKGVYVVENGQAVVVKAKNTVTEVTATSTSAGDPAPTMRYAFGGGAIVNDIKYLATATAGYTILDALAEGMGAYAMAKPATYNLTWKAFGASTTLPAGTIYVEAKKTKTSSGRLNIIWLDDSEEATAIKTVKSANAENGAIYNLAGQKVSASYKGVVIKDGKKYIQK